ncbi:hypothetical protein MAR_025114 [Mya arenaria]|uniref:Endonuclease/exonuclease/phosphatase domain-containing protein n=1 Tax=Mya arenaria TaxID=6604 RepID=A0ABY7DSQ7_MYAAR|nr:hypothetical protein MAR_025114 [Mya arenaria]
MKLKRQTSLNHYQISIAHLIQCSAHYILVAPNTLTIQITASLNSLSGRTTSIHANKRSSVFESLPAKQNLRIIASIDYIDYIKPDNICGTESLLRGVKPSKNKSLDATENTEIFPGNYTVYRNDRSSRGGGVFIAVQSNIASVECVDGITNCEIETVESTLKGKKDFYISSFYMPKRNTYDLEQLSSALSLTINLQQKQYVLCGDFNCTDINWNTLSVPNDINVQDRPMQQKLIDLSVENSLTQVHDQPIRQGNILDLVFASNPSLVKSSVNLDSKPIYSKTKPRKIYLFQEANLDNLKLSCKLKVIKFPRYTNMRMLRHFRMYSKLTLLKYIEENVASKTVKKEHCLPWLNRNRKEYIRKKARFENWSKFRNIQKEWIKNKNSKPFWEYVKSKKKENIALASPITKRFQCSVDTGTLPAGWRNANISPVFIKGDGHLAENYRPVSLTTVLCYFRTSHLWTFPEAFLETFHPD